MVRVNPSGGRGARARRGLGLLTVLLTLGTGAAPAAAQDVLDPGIADGSAQRELDAAQAKWRQASLLDYHYDAALLCFCRPEVRTPARVTVRAGRAGAAPEHLSTVTTVPKLFAVVREAVQARVATLTVAYGELGVPRSIWIDRSAAIADEEIGYQIEGFTDDGPTVHAGDVSLRLQWRGPLGAATRTLVCAEGALRRGWPDPAACGRIVADGHLREPITVETRDFRWTADPRLFVASGRIEGRRVDFAWRGSGSGTRLHRLREWEAALGGRAIDQVRGGSG